MEQTTCDDVEWIKLTHERNHSRAKWAQWHKVHARVLNKVSLAFRSVKSRRRLLASCLSVRPHLSTLAPAGRICVKFMGDSYWKIYPEDPNLVKIGATTSGTLHGDPSTFMFNVLYQLTNVTVQIWSDFDWASSLICGNKMPTRCNRWFLLQILLLAPDDGHSGARNMLSKQ